MDPEDVNPRQWPYTGHGRSSGHSWASICDPNAVKSPRRSYNLFFCFFFNLGQLTIEFSQFFLLHCLRYLFLKQPIQKLLRS